MPSIILYLIILNVLIIVHELGHYIAAKRAGVEVKEFAVGLGPVLFQKEWNNTLWKVKIFPIGGYNALKGEVESEGGSGNFSNTSKRNKIYILVAGAFMNILIAIITFYGMFLVSGWKISIAIPITPVGAELQTEKAVGGPVIIEALETSTLSKDNIKLPVELIRINNEDINTAKDAVEKIKNYYATDTKAVTVTLKDIVNQTETTIPLEYIDGDKIGITIVDPQSTYSLNYGTSIWNKAASGFSHSINTIIMVGTFFKQMIVYIFQTNDLSPVSYSVAGPVGVYTMFDSIIKSSTDVIRDILHVTGLISLNLGLFNLLPFPALDGWYIMIVFIEKARKKKIDETLVGKISLVGFILLLIFSFLITVKDIFIFILR